MEMPDDFSTIYAETITGKDLKEHLQIIASNTLEGRETGKRGQKMAAAYIHSEFRSFNLDKLPTGSFYQKFKLFYTFLPQGTLRVGNQEFTCNKDFFFNGNSTQVRYGGIPIVLGGEDEDGNGTRDLKNKSVLILNTNQNEVGKNYKKAFGQGASNIFLMTGQDEGEFQEMASKIRKYTPERKISSNHPSLAKKEPNTFYISPTICAAILGKAGLDFKTQSDKSYALLKPSEITVEIDKEILEIETENILGTIEGSDLKEEIVVVSAHYDHIGIFNGQIYRGADDNGSGTSALLEIAEAFAVAKANGNGPRRSIVFAAFTGEEKGLLGSDHYTKNPIYALENTVANLNMDMIGRVDEKYVSQPEGKYIYLVGSDKLSMELHELSEKVNSKYTRLHLDYSYNDEKHPQNIYKRSDHWNFAKHNVPVIFYISGFHEDYHKPTDLVDKINFAALQDRTKLIFHTAWVLANKNERPRLDKAE